MLVLCGMFRRDLRVYVVGWSDWKGREGLVMGIGILVVEGLQSLCRFEVY